MHISLFAKLICFTLTEPLYIHDNQSSRIKTISLKKLTNRLTLVTVQTYYLVSVLSLKLLHTLLTTYTYYSVYCLTQDYGVTLHVFFL